MITRDEFDITGRFVIELESADAAFILRDVLDVVNPSTRADGLVDELRQRLSGWLAAVETDDDDDTYSEFDAITGIEDRAAMRPEGS